MADTRRLDETNYTAKYIKNHGDTGHDPIIAAPSYAERVTGAPPGAADAQSTFTILPEGKKYEDKFVFGIFSGNQMVGCIDLIRGYPTAAAATLGLLLVAEQHQRAGIGRLAYAQMGEKRSYRYGSVCSETAIMEKSLGHSVATPSAPDRV